MKNATIFHGTGDSPDLFWHPYIRRSLEAQGYDVWAPQLPDAEIPDINIWLPFALEHSYNEDSVLIGHSAGCPLILALLERLEMPVRKSILVAGYGNKITHPQPILKGRYDWDRIAKNGGEMIFINSDNDPWGCDDVAGRYLFDQLGGTLIIRHGEGHMGSARFGQPYREFPLLLSLIDEIEHLHVQ